MPVPDRSVALLVLGIAVIGLTPVLMLIVYLARGRRDAARLPDDSPEARVEAEVAGVSDAGLKAVAISLTIVALVAVLSAWWVMAR
jgi:hypothetical protein